MFRKRKNPTPSFRIPPPFQPMSADHAPLQIDGIYPYSAIVQVVAEDTKDNYVICRGFDTRVSKFDENLAVAKPYGKRYPGAYRVAQVFMALLPLQTGNPSPEEVDWRVGQNPGYAVGQGGHPYNLTEKIDELYTDEGILINYMLVDSGDELVLLSPVGCFSSYPKEPAQFYLWELVECVWTITTTIVAAEDTNDTNYLLPCETQWARSRGCTVVAEWGSDVPIYDLVGTRGLLRRVKASADISCGAIGSAVVHEVVACVQETESPCTLDICNTWGNQQCIVEGDELEVDYIKRGVWTPRYRRNSIYKAVLSSEMCPDAQSSEVAVEQVEPQDYCESEEALALLTQFDNENNHAGMAGDTVFAVRDNTKCDSIPVIIDVKKKCQDLAAPQDACDGDGVFLYKDGCQEIRGSVRKKSAIESCTPLAVLVHQLPLSRISVSRSALVKSNCVISLMNYDTEVCVLESADEGQPASAGGITFGTDVAWQNLQLEVNKGGQGSGSGECASPSLKLTGARIPVLTLADCGEYGTEQETLHSIPLVEQDIVANIDASGCLTWVNSVALVLGTCGQESQEAAECEEYVCQDGSGSGSG